MEHKKEQERNKEMDKGKNVNKNKSKRIGQLLLFFGLAVWLITNHGETVFAKQTSSSMNLYGIYVNSAEKGDAVLLESDGKYLLMDMGMASHMPVICEQLDAVGAVHIDLYFSHLHKDHVGGSQSDWLYGLKYLYEHGFVIDTLYLPDPSVVPESAGYAGKYGVLKTYMEVCMGGQDKIVYLQQGSTFQIGSVDANVIGPSQAFVSSIHPSDYANKVSEGDEGTEYGAKVMDTYYENNCSLITMFTCGNVKYLTTGDMLKDEANYMSATYGNALKADIYKMAHHGTATGNTRTLLTLVDPDYSFAQNASFTGVDSVTGQWRFINACKVTRTVSMPYFIANEKDTIIYHVKNNKISVYKGSTLDDAAQLSGWVSVYGADGWNRKKDYYYIGKSGIPLTGIQTIGSHTYYLNSGGCMVYGDYDDNGNYNPWKTYTNGQQRYFKISDRGTLVYMLTGFSKIKGKTYYFKKNGLKLEGEEKFSLVTIGSNVYGIQADSSFVLNTLINYNGKNYYFAKDGKMAVKKIVSIGGKKLYFGKYGTQVKDQFVQINKQYYYFGEDGNMVRNTVYEYDDEFYYFNKNGVMARKSFVTIKGKTYYFGKYGTMVCSKKVRIGGSAYYFGEDGAMYKDRVETIGKKTYQFDKNGKMKVVE